MAKKIAVVLCGSGFLDGSEIRESVGVLWSLSKNGAEVECFAPDADQHHVINTLSQSEASGEKRNMLVEGARIARSEIKPLSDLDVNKFDGLAIPGGFGVAKNLCSFAFEGSAGKVNHGMDSIIQSFHNSGKPILAVCIAPALVGLSIRDKSMSLTMGAESEAATELEKLGHKHCPHPANEFHVDKENKVFTTPAYMYDDASLANIFAGIEGATGAFISAC